MMKKILFGLLVIIVIWLSYLTFVYLKTPIYNDDFIKSPTPSPAPVSLIPILLSPKPGDAITGPLIIKGYVPKSWIFEGQFRMKLLDDKRQLIIQDRVPVEWDNENTKETLYFVESYNYHTTAKSGYLVLENDNPSGLPENQKSIEIPVIFATPPPGTVYLFLYNLEEDKKICDCVACQVVIPESFHLGTSSTPIKDTLNLLAKRMNPNFYVKSLNLKNSLLTIEFPLIANFTDGGSCKQGINTLQVTKTALQFPEVKQVKLSVGMFQP